MLFGSVFKSVWELFCNLEGLKDGILSQPKVFFGYHQIEVLDEVSTRYLSHFCRTLGKKSFF